MATQEVYSPVIKCIRKDDDYYSLGLNGVTRIDRVEYAGEHAMIPYLQVWAGDKILFECVMHKLDGIYYK